MRLRFPDGSEVEARISNDGKTISLPARDAPHGELHHVTIDENEEPQVVIAAVSFASNSDGFKVYRREIDWLVLIYKRSYAVCEATEEERASLAVSPFAPD